jgi:hypothetical protein
VIRELAVAQWNRQLLQRDVKLTVEEAVELAGGIYSTAPTSYLSFAARIPDFHRSQLDNALIRDRSLARLGTLRGSGFLVPIAKGDAVMSAADRTPWYQRSADKLVGEETTAEWRVAVLGLLDGQPLPARSIRQQLGVEGRGGEALRYLLSAMTQTRELAAATAEGGWRSNQYNYAIWSQWFPDHPPAQVEPESARADVARWYLQGHGPGTVDHFSWWSGLNTKNARLALDAVADDDDGVYDLEVDPPSEPSGLRLLPVWDTALVAPRGRRRMVRTENQPFVYDASGNVTSTVVRDGEVIGVWDRGGDDRRIEIKAVGFKPFNRHIRSLVADEAGLMASSVGADEVEVEFVDQLVDLTAAPRNRFLSPLKGS